jgi:hypothetical protein
LKSSNAESADVQPRVGMMVAYHPAADEGLGHAIRPAVITQATRTGEECHLVLSVFLSDGRLVVRDRPVYATAQRHGAAVGHWDFLPDDGDQQ